MKNLGKTNKLLAGALGVQILLLGATSFARDDKKFVAPTKLFPELVPDKVTKITITGNTGSAAEKKLSTTVLSKSGTSWGIEGADNYPVDAAKLDTFLKNVEKLKAGGAVVNKESFYKKLEVGDEDFQRKIVLTHDGKEIAFVLGSSPGFKRVHLRKLGQKDVVEVEGLAVWDVGARAADWVDRSYFKVPEADVWAVNLVNGRGTVKMEKAPGGEWAIVGGKPGEVQKKTAVDDLVRKVASVNLEEPVGKTIKPEFGLDAPTATIMLVTGSSTIAGAPPKITKTETILVGAKNGTNAYYVKSASSDYVVSAPSWAIEPLTTKMVADLFEQPKTDAKVDLKKPK